MRCALVCLTAGLAGLLLTVAAAAAWLAWASLPRVAGELEVAGLAAPVAIVRDAQAIPRIRAGTAADAYQALGFVHGQDRLWQMEIDRLAGQGRLAEVLGETALPLDRFMRTLGLQGRAERALPGVDPATRALLDAYARGVNAAIAAFGFALPPEFMLLRHRPEPWRPVDSLRLSRLMALQLSGNWREELLRARLAAHLSPEQMRDLWPDSPAPGPVTLAALAGLPLDALTAGLPAPPAAGLGSNVWVAAGARTASGAPLLANDPHLELQLPGHWYLAALEAPGLAVIGATMPGLPFVVLGRNQDLAWGFTNTGSDTQDLFVEQVDPADPARYLIPGGSAPFLRRSETLLVRDSSPVQLEVRETRHGPVLSDLSPTMAEAAGPGRVLALAWTQLLDDAPDTTLAAGFALARARDAAGFVAGAELYRGAQQNMAFAVRDGGIGMISPGLVPIRRAGDGTGPVPGWTGEYDWLGTIPAADLPRRLDPPQGLLINANNRLVGPDYPYFLTSRWEAPYRAERIGALLGDGHGFDQDRFAAVQLDVASRLAADLRPFLPAPEAVAPGNRAALAALRSWDGVAAADRPEPLLFAAWYRALGTAIAGDELGPAWSEIRDRPNFLLRVLTGSPGWCDRRDTAPVETCAGIAAAALDSAMAELTAAYGADWQGWRWGTAHPALLAHRPFEQVPWLRDWFSRLVAVGGDATTVNVAAPGSTRPELPYAAYHAAGYRAIYDLAAPDRSRWIAVAGQSGNPLSPHYADLASLWAEGRYLEMSLAPADAMSLLRLLPGGGQ